MAKVRIAGLDGSLRNFGVAKMILDTETMALSVEDLILVKTVKSKVKQVRISSDYLDAAQQITRTVAPAVSDCACVFFEVPSGGQDYRAVMGFGIVIGIYASLTRPCAEVSPAETKMAAVGTKTASKEEMIEWAMEQFPGAPWLTRKLKGKIVPIAANEHLADAVAIVHAGIRTPSFQQTIAILNTKVA
jgi:Holliday junction resolvasome RuvABC endonuclease subunit